MGDYGGQSTIPAESYSSSVLHWVAEHTALGDQFLLKQHGYNLIDKTIAMIMGMDKGLPREPELSQWVDNEGGSIALRLAGAMTDVKPFVDFRTSNSTYDQQADVTNKLFFHWWYARAIDKVFVDGIKWAIAGGSGYIHTFWRPDIQDFDCVALHPHDVLPILPSRQGDLESCYAVIVREEVPTNELKRRWPQKAQFIQMDMDGIADEDRDAATRISSAANTSTFSRYINVIKRAVANYLSSSAMPVSYLFTCYIKDYTRNTSGRERLMGPWGKYDTDHPEVVAGRRKSGEDRDLTNWSYRVKPGERLYPFGRTVVATRGCVIYDGPSQYWYGQLGMIPVDKLTLDDWPYPKCWFGKSPLWDILEDQQELNEAQRAISDHTKKALDPDLVIDQGTGLGRQAQGRINMRRAGGRFTRRPGPGNGVTVLTPPPLPAEILTRPQMLIDRMNTKSGIKDLDVLLKLGQMPAGDTLDKFMESSTTAIKIRSRNLEVFARKFAMKAMFNIAQYKTVAERLAVCGPQGMTSDDWDFDPETFVPSHVGSDYLPTGQLNPALRRSDGSYVMRPRWERWREIARYLSINIMPGTLLKAAKYADQMAYFQFFRAGILDPWTLAEVFEIPNYGEAPGGARTVTERLIAAFQNGLMGQVSPAGRKSAGETSPKMKGNGTITESEES